ncbi:MAG: efflux RND transporter periplasmic adaptor subunit [Burkholderiales bacterium]|nr:efflux RND transporter periplasmic adaptor subunit [Burkholderiales bacterium]
MPTAVLQPLPQSLSLASPRHAWRFSSRPVLQPEQQSLRRVHPAWSLSLLLLAAVLALPASAAPSAASAPPGASAPAKAALTVTVVSPSSAQVAATLAANGNIAAWQEAIIGSEANGLRLAEVKVEIGQQVKRGQLLAVFAADTLKAELAQTQAALAEAEATLAEAAGNAARARALRDSGVMTIQQVQQSLTAETTAKARVAAQKAQLEVQQLRLAQTQVLSPDDGLISARLATVGSVVGAGQELFRLIRGGRLEWRAEVPAADLARVRPGQRTTLTTPSGRTVPGIVRQIAPTVDANTRNGLVYVDLRPGPDSDARAGMFARGEFAFDKRQVATLPSSAVLLRDGFEVVMKVGADSRVAQTKVKVLSRDGDRVALEGLGADVRVVERGAAFLSDGDTVRVVKP